MATSEAKRKRGRDGRPGGGALAGAARPSRPELWIPLTYAAAAGAWIALSDRLVVSAAASKEQVAAWSIAKGLGFVLATGLLLFLFVRHAIERDRRAGRELADRDAQLRAIAEAVPGPVFLKDLEGRWLFANPAALEVLGRSAGEVLGRTDREVMPEAAAISMAADRRVLESRSAEALEERVATPAGERVFLVTRAPYRDAEGRIVGLIGSGSDITEQKDAEARLQQSQKLESVGRLAGGIAHDFNNLLTVILGGAESLRERLQASRAEEPEELDEIRAAAGRASELTRQLLAFARKQVIAPVPLDLNAAVRGAERLLRRVLGEDIALRVDLEPEPWTTLCDPGQLEQAILNLAVNARDAMPRGGTLTLQTRNVATPGGQGEWVSLVVRDDGVGMSAEVRTHLFEPFFTTKPAGAGTGLGLASVYGIVRQSGGEIQVETEPTRGTTFTLRFPRHHGPGAAAPEPVARSSPGGTETVLVIEDDRQVREVTVRALRAAGYHVLVAADAAEALALMERGEAPPQLVVTDVVMPGLDGRAVSAALRSRNRQLRVLFVSGYTQDVIHHHGVLDSGVDFLSKPFTPAALLARVRKVLDAAAEPED